MKRVVFWIVVSVVALVVIAIGIFIVIHNSQPQLVGGPVAIVRYGPPGQSEPTKRGFLGLQFQPEQTAVLKVKQVTRGSGADQAGILAGDIVVAIEDQATRTTKDVFRVLEKTEPNSVVHVTIRRGDAEQEMNVRLISFEESILLYEQDNRDSQLP